MAEATTLFSLPGEWIDRRGRPRPRFPIRRILVLKPDHIGDFLMVDPAIALLRQFFPEARIELVCGSWNVGLAERLGRFDAVHAVDMFHEVSGEQSSEVVAEEARERGAKALAALALGPFDLAVDLRYDMDSRRFLQNVDARAYAGFGQASAIPFLDIVVPRDEGANLKGAAEILLGRHDFRPTDAGTAAQDAQKRLGGKITAREILLAFEIQGSASPKACGVSMDERVLGVALEGVSARGLAAPDAEPEREAAFPLAPIFRRGWNAPEPWGAWSKDRLACVSLLPPAELSAPFARIDLTLRGNAIQNNPEVNCRILAPNAGTEACVLFTSSSTLETVSLVVPTRNRRISLASTAFELLPGRYQGQLRIYLPHPPGRATCIELTLRGLTGKAALARLSFGVDANLRGIIDLPFSCLVETAGERLRVEFDCGDADLLEGGQIEHVSLILEHKFRVPIPFDHIGERASLLMLRVAQVFSDEPPFGAAAPHLAAGLKLMDPLPGTKVPHELDASRQRLDSWKDDGYALVGLALGCNTAIRKWPFIYFVELARELLQLPRVKIVFLGGPADREESVAACAELGLDPAEHSLCGSAKLEEVGLLLGKLDLFIGNNSGLTHFAGKTGIRTIGVYSGTNHPRAWGPIGENASWIYRDEPCAPCHLSDLAKCTHGHSCIREILPADLISLAEPELQAVLSKRPDRQRVSTSPGDVEPSGALGLTQAQTRVSKASRHVPASSRSKRTIYSPLP